MWPFRKKTTIDEEELAQQAFEEGLFSVKDLIAPAAMLIKPNHIEINSFFAKTLFVLTYPQYVEANWLSAIINLDAGFDISMHIYPVDSANIGRMLRRKVSEMESSLRINQEKGAI
ncbi:TPA: conjugal transfer protein TraC, partial [Patescibacteria group bacterium]|nr:conjugal transfer protein TraC [Patescibacteria group bacterium]